MKMRMIKSNEEIEIIKNGSRIADLGGEEIAKNIREDILIEHIIIEAKKVGVL